MSLTDVSPVLIDNAGIDSCNALCGDDLDCLDACGLLDRGCDSFSHYKLLLTIGVYDLTATRDQDGVLFSGVETAVSSGERQQIVLGTGP